MWVFYPHVRSDSKANCCDRGYRPKEACRDGRTSFLMLRDHLFRNALSNKEYRATEFEPTKSNLGICQIAPFTA